MKYTFIVLSSVAAFTSSAFGRHIQPPPAKRSDKLCETWEPNFGSLPQSTLSVICDNDMNFCTESFQTAADYVNMKQSKRDDFENQLRAATCYVGVDNVSKVLDRRGLKKFNFIEEIWEDIPVDDKLGHREWPALKKESDLVQDYEKKGKDKAASTIKSLLKTLETYGREFSPVDQGRKSGIKPCPMCIIDGWRCSCDEIDPRQRANMLALFDIVSLGQQEQGIIQLGYRLAALLDASPNFARRYSVLADLLTSLKKETREEMIYHDWDSSPSVQSSVSAYSLRSTGILENRTASTEYRHPPQPELPASTLENRSPSSNWRAPPPPVNGVLATIDSIYWSWDLPHSLFPNNDDVQVDFFTLSMEAVITQSEWTRNQQRELATTIGDAGRYLDGQAHLIADLVENRDIKRYEKLDDIYAPDVLAAMDYGAIATYVQNGVRLIDVHTPLPRERQEFKLGTDDLNVGISRLLTMLKDTKVKNDVFWAAQCGEGVPFHCNDEDPNIRALQFALFDLVAYAQQRRAMCFLGKTIFQEIWNKLYSLDGRPTIRLLKFYNELGSEVIDKVLAMDQF